MSSLIDSSTWAMYRQLINDASDTFNNEIIIWNRLSIRLDRDGDDSALANNSFQTINLKALLQYNVFRTWPIDRSTDTGIINNQSVMIILNKDYLAGLGYINADNNFDFDPSNDYFTVHGVDYKPMGDTAAAQADNDPLLVFVICERMRVPTGKKLF